LTTGLRITMLGSGTSSGVPVIGCDCEVCSSPAAENKRFRAGLMIEFDGRVVLVDTPTDLRQQALRFALKRVDAILFTHAHADHIFGLDDVRIFNFRQRQRIPCFGSATTLAALRRTFAYVFEPGEEGGGKPRLDLVDFGAALDLFGRRVLAVPVLHGTLPVNGYRIGSFAYVTDCSHIPEESFALLEGLDVLVLGALRYREHPTHFSIAQAVAVARRIGAGRTYFTHLAHDVDHHHPQVELPATVGFGYDGLVFELD
jgi:phosphoribosyl 1,2-cyclic phosphate phosphodiesterase